MIQKTVIDKAFRNITLTLLVCCICGCGFRINLPDNSNPALAIDIVHVIPEDYEGFVLIMYDCPGGVPLFQNQPQMIIQYNPDGTFCTSDSPVATRGKVWAKTLTGQAIPVRGMVDNKRHQEYALFLDGSRTISLADGSYVSFMVNWVGRSEGLRRLQGRQGTYNKDLDLFIEARFGLDINNAVKAYN